MSTGSEFLGDGLYKDPHISCNIFHYIWLEWHIHIRSTDNVAQLAFFDFEDAWNQLWATCE